MAMNASTIKTYLKSDLQSRGWTPKMIQNWLGKPDFTTQRLGGGERHHYYTKRVHKIESKGIWQTEANAVKLRREARQASLSPTTIQRKVDQHAARLERKYSNPKEALPTACLAMFNLNRYAKYPNCKQSTRADIYDLKNQLIRVLHLHDYTLTVQSHKLPESQCFECNGESAEFALDSDEGEEICSRCGGTGIFREGIELVCFTFNVEGKRYSWHVRADEITFPYSATHAILSPISTRTLRPLSITRQKAMAGRALIRWLVKKLAKATAFKEKISRQMASSPAVNRPHCESLEKRLANLGELFPLKVANEIRKGNKVPRDVFEQLRHRRVQQFREKIRSQLAHRRPRHAPHGISLTTKLFNFIPKGTAYRRTMADELAFSVRQGKVNFLEAVALAAHGGEKKGWSR
jgi:hypothetical protein